MAQIRWARAGALAPGRVCTEFPKDKEFRAFEMLEKIEFSLKPRRCVLFADLTTKSNRASRIKLLLSWPS
jgi:hypothetical protein